MKQWKWLAGLMVFACLLLFPAGKTQAATQLKQSSQSQNVITVTWEDPNAGYSSYTTTGYDLYFTAYNGGKSLSEVTPFHFGASTKQCTLSGLQPGTQYMARLSYTYTTKSGGSYTGSLTNYNLVTAPGKVTGVALDVWYHYTGKFYLKWDKQDACKYEYVIKKYNGAGFQSGTTTSSYPSVYSEKKAANAVYYAQVRAFTNTPDGTKLVGPWSDVTYFSDQPYLNTTVKMKKTSFTVKWNKIAGITRYDVYASRSQNSGYKKVKSLGKNKKSLTIKKVAGKKVSYKKKYWVYVVGVGKFGGKTYMTPIAHTWEIRKR